MKKMLYVLFVNKAAGESFITSVDTTKEWSYQEIGKTHFDNIFESYSREEVEKYLEEYSSIKEYRVIIRKEDDYALVKSLDDCTSGSLQSLCINYDAYDYGRPFSSKEEAEQAADSWNSKYYNK